MNFWPSLGRMMTCTSYQCRHGTSGRELMNTRNRMALIGLAIAMVACGGGGGGDGPDCRYNEDWLNGRCSVGFTLPPITIPDGIWRGVDSGGRDVLAIVNRFSSFQFVDGFKNQGAGFLVVGIADVVDSNFQLVTPLGATFSDGTTAADCTFSGTVIEQQTLSITENCKTSTGLQFNESLILTFDAQYNRSASLAIIAGTYQTPVGNTMSIGSDGAIFEQEAVSGCVTNGQVGIAVSFGNTYFFDYGIDNCTGADAIWNGASFSGLAFLDNTVLPEVLEYAVIGELGGVPISVVVSNDRL